MEFEPYVALLESLTVEDFRGYVDQTLEARLQDGTTRLELAEAEVLTGGDARSFVLLFRLKGSPSFADGYVMLEHPERGQVPLYLTRVHPESDGTPLYETIFNRITPLSGKPSES